jgi:hypothetical protein
MAMLRILPAAATYHGSDANTFTAGNEVETTLTLFGCVVPKAVSVTTAFIKSTTMVIVVHTDWVALADVK